MLQLYFTFLCILVKVMCSEEPLKYTTDHTDFASDESSEYVSEQINKIDNRHQRTSCNLDFKADKENSPSKNERKQNKSNDFATDTNLQQFSTDSASNVSNNSEKKNQQFCEKPKRPVAVVRPYRVTTIEQDFTHQSSQNSAPVRQVLPSNAENEFSNVAGPSPQQLESTIRDVERRKKKGKKLKGLTNVAFTILEVFSR